MVPCIARLVSIAALCAGQGLAGSVADAVDHAMVHSAKKKKKVMEIMKKGHNKVVTGKTQKERANLDEVQKFFPKIKKEEEEGGGAADPKKHNDLAKDGPDDFVDDVAASLDDAQADLLVADQPPSTVCSRDIKKFCGTTAMKGKHPLHCLGLLKPEEKAQIHKLCRVHVENSLSFTCAQDMQDLDCDPVMVSTLDCLSEQIDKVSADCGDQVRLISKVVAKVNNAEVTVTEDLNGTHQLTKYHGGEYDPNWVCSQGFEPHSEMAGCCSFVSEAEGCMGISKFRCAKRQCKVGGGRWILKQDEPAGPLAGHLCCAPPKTGIQRFITPSGVLTEIGLEEGVLEIAEDGSVELTAASRRDLLLLCIMLACLAYWKWDLVKRLALAAKALALNEVDKVDIPGMPAIELTTFFEGLLAPPKDVKQQVESESQGGKLRQWGDPVKGNGLYGGL